MQAIYNKTYNTIGQREKLNIISEEKIANDTKFLNK